MREGTIILCQPLAGKLWDRFIRAVLIGGLRIRSIHLLWQRQFEIGFDLEVDLP